MAVQLPHHPIFAIDMRNHGASPHSPVHVYPAMANDLAAVAHELGFGKYIPVGHSMGGKAVMFFSLTYPNLIDSLVVVDTAPSGYSTDNRDSAGVANALNKMPLEDGTITNIQQADDYLKPDIPSKGVRDFLLENLRFVDGKGSWRVNLVDITKEMDKITSEEPHGLGSLDRPVLFLRGTKSPYIDMHKHGKFMKQLFPHSRVEDVPGSRHWVHMDNPALFVQKIVHFVRQHHP